MDGAWSGSEPEVLPTNDVACSSGPIYKHICARKRSNAITVKKKPELSNAITVKKKKPAKAAQ